MSTMPDELDYMSDDFITKLINNSQEDVRPGLLKNRSEQREHELMKRKAEAAAEKKNKKSIQVCEAEALEEGLKQRLSSSNKGFSMLQKMGFKDGMGLGKDNRGMIEPIAINIKNNKQGLGHKVQPPKIPSQKRKLDDNLNNFSEKDYMAFHSKKDRGRKIISDLKKSQRICKELDIKNNKNKPNEIWFWPDDDENADKTDAFHDSDEEKEDEKMDNLSDETKLEILTTYLRESYYYCIWCSVQYEDEQDLKECPGLTRDDH